MRYLCLVYAEERQIDSLPKDEMDRFFKECADCSDELKESGHFLAGEALQPVCTATTVRVRGHRSSVTDGPFAETKEQLGGFCLIEAKDLNEAVRIASSMPPARYGSIEVRPISTADPR